MFPISPEVLIPDAHVSRVIVSAQGTAFFPAEA